MRWVWAYLVLSTLCLIGVGWMVWTAPTEEEMRRGIYRHQRKRRRTEEDEGWWDA